MNSRQCGTLVQALGSAITHGGAALNDIPDLLKRLLLEQAWRDFETPMHEQVHHDRFEDFITTPPSKGLGASVGLIKRIVAKDREAARLLRQSLESKDCSYGESESYALEYLSEHRPDIYERVLTREISPHQGMIDAGKHHRRVSVRVDDVGSVARTLRKNLTADQIDELVRRLIHG